MSFTTIPQSTLPENRPTPDQGNLSRYEFRTAPYDAFDPGPWLWRPAAEYRRDLRTGRHRRGESPDPLPVVERADTGARRRPRPHPPLVPFAPVDQPAPVDPFAQLREDAWARFLESSAPLARAHTAVQEPQRRNGFRSRLVRWAHRIGQRLHNLALTPPLS
jgi:hypothetical protein